MSQDLEQIHADYGAELIPTKRIETPVKVAFNAGDRISMQIGPAKNRLGTIIIDRNGNYENKEPGVSDESIGVRVDGEAALRWVDSPEELSPANYTISTPLSAEDTRDLLKKSAEASIVAGGIEFLPRNKKEIETIQQWALEKHATIREGDTYEQQVIKNSALIPRESL